MTWTKTGSIQGPPGPDSSSTITIQTAQTVNYSFVDGDVGQCVPFNLTGPGTATLTSALDADISPGQLFYVRQDGDYPVTVVADVGSGITVRSPNGAATSGNGDWRAVIKFATDVWDVL